MSVSPAHMLRRFGFRQTLKGALIIGTITGLLMGAQGIAYAKAFPDQASRQKLVVSLQSVSAVNFLSGEIANAATPASYALYKSLPLVTLVSGTWGLLTVTRLLRGNEEDGRLEVMMAGVTTKRAVSGQVLLGFAGSLALAGVVAFALIAALGSTPAVRLSVGASVFMTAAALLPGVVFAALGVLTSQLALTRSRAVLYGLLPLLALYVVRGSANSVTSVNWLKKLTPFGWSDLLNPVLGVHAFWIVPTVVFAALFASLGMFWAGRRDMGAALIRQSEAARSHFYLLRSSFKFSVRRNIWSFVWWGLGTVVFAVFFTALAGFSVKLAGDSSAFQRLFSATSDNEIKVAFLGVGTFFVAVVLLVMATLNIVAVRRDEAKGYLDNLLVQPTRRSAWLVGRLLLATGMVTLIAVLSGLAMWFISRVNHIDIGLSSVLQGAVSLVGILVLTIGIGAFLYGVLPRLAVAGMAVVIGWGFVVDILKSLFSLNDLVTKTSLLSYIPTSPATMPNWTAVVWLIVIGVVLATSGVVGFSKRDIVAE